MRNQIWEEERRQELREWDEEMKWRALNPGWEAAEEEFLASWMEDQEAARASAAAAAAKAAANAKAKTARRERKAVKASVAMRRQAVLLPGAKPVLVGVAGSVKGRHTVVSPDGWTTVVPRGTVLDNASD